MTATESGELPIAIILTHVAVTIGFVALGVYDISKQRRADPTPAEPELVGSASGAYGVPRCAPSPSHLSHSRERARVPSEMLLALSRRTPTGSRSSAHSCTPDAPNR